MKAYKGKRINKIVIYVKTGVGPLPLGLTQSIGLGYSIKNNKKYKG